MRSIVGRWLGTVVKPFPAVSGMVIILRFDLRGRQAGSELSGQGSDRRWIILQAVERKELIRSKMEGRKSCE